MEGALPLEVELKNGRVDLGSVALKAAGVDGEVEQFPLAAVGEVLVLDGDLLVGLQHERPVGDDDQLAHLLVKRVHGRVDVAAGGERLHEVRRALPVPRYQHVAVLLQLQRADPVSYCGVWDGEILHVNAVDVVESAGVPFKMEITPTEVYPSAKHEQLLALVQLYDGDGRESHYDRVVTAAFERFRRNADSASHYFRKLVFELCKGCRPLLVHELSLGCLRRQVQ